MCTKGNVKTVFGVAVRNFIFENSCARVLQSVIAYSFVMVVDEFLRNSFNMYYPLKLQTATHEVVGRPLLGSEPLLLFPSASNFFTHRDQLLFPLNSAQDSHVNKHYKGVNCRLRYYVTG